MAEEMNFLHFCGWLQMAQIGMSLSAFTKEKLAECVDRNITCIESSPTDSRATSQGL
jgi:hypothetical protein